MPEESKRHAKPVLEPIERVSEVLFGIIMVLTFTGSLSIAGAGREDVRVMFIGAIGCNLAWGLVDAVMYLMSSLTERARGRDALRAVREATDPRHAHARIAGALPPLIASVVGEAELEAIRQRLTQLSDVPSRILSKEDWLGAIGVFLLVFLSTFPIVLPFIFMSDAGQALRVSNLVAIVMLFICGFKLGRVSGHGGWLVGLVMVLLGAGLAALTLALGG